MARVALRVLPLVGQGFKTQELDQEEQYHMCLTTFRACAISWAARKFPTHELALNDASIAAAESASNAANNDSLTPRSAFAATITAFEAVLLGGIVSDATAIAVQAVFESKIATSEDSFDIIWQSVSADAQWLEESRMGKEPNENAAQILAGSPLWLNGIPREILAEWKKTKNHLHKLNQKWSVWTKWYDTRLEGPPTYLKFSEEENEKLEVARALIDESEWKQGPAHVNGLIKEMEDDAMQGVFPDLPPISDEGAGKAGTTGLPGGKSRTGRLPGDNVTPDPPPTPAPGDTNLKLLSDRVNPSVDYLDRAVMALILAGRLNESWGDMNPADGPDENQKWKPFEPGFVVHLDAPWGGGKTSFASYVAQILNPWRIKGKLPDWLIELKLNDPKNWREDFRRPWHIVHFNAWQHHHVSPPWWAFYQTIRKQCMTALRDEDNQRTSDEMPPPVEPYRYKEPKDRWVQWLMCGAGELKWRLFTPKIKISALVVLFSLITLYFISGYLPDTGASSTIVKLVLGLAAPVWGFFTVISNTLVPGTAESARNYVVGAGDPMERFRQHFICSMERFERPVLVVVDDLDRCEPKFVVELIRGMQTILVSPRVIFLLLGDRDWIEKSFDEEHKAMLEIGVGPEHELGARFVEKAIQFSFVLPDVGQDTRGDYLRSLLGLGAETSDQPDEPDAATGDEAVPETVREEFEKAMDITDFQSRETETARLLKKKSYTSLPGDVRARFETQTAQELTRRAVSDKTVTGGTRHMLEALVGVMPANPRQVKRIINALTILQQVAGIKNLSRRPGSPEWQLLARWVVLMTEWPKTWFTLTRHPGLADRVLTRKKPNITGLSDSQVTELVKTIKEEEAVMAILTFSNVESGWGKRPITTEEIKWLGNLVPATSGEMLPINKLDVEET